MIDWNKNKWFIFSGSLAFVVAMWDIQYAKDNFETGSSFLVVIMMFQIHLSFIVLPYMGNTSFNKFMRGVFFFAALLPASLQISSNFLKKMESKILVMPEIPKEPLIDPELDKAISSSKYYRYLAKKSGNENDFKKYDKQYDELQEQKLSYRIALAKYNTDMQEYPEKKRKYDEYNAKSKLTLVFDYLNLIFPFIAIIGIQIMNGYSSKIGSQERGINEIEAKPALEPGQQKPEKKKKYPWNIINTKKKKKIKKEEPKTLNPTPENPLPNSEFNKL